MSHTYAQNVIHVVFSTKDRRKSIGREFQIEFFAMGERGRPQVLMIENLHW